MVFLVISEWLEDGVCGRAGMRNYRQVFCSKILTILCVRDRSSDPCPTSISEKHWGVRLYNVFMPYSSHFLVSPLIHLIRFTSGVRDRSFPPMWMTTISDRSPPLNWAVGCCRVGQHDASAGLPSPPKCAYTQQSPCHDVCLWTCDSGIAQNPLVGNPGSTHISFPWVVKEAVPSVPNLCAMCLGKHHISPLTPRSSHLPP